MVSFSTLLASTTLLLSTAIHALPTTTGVAARAEDKILCSYDGPKGIIKPKPNTTITISKATAEDYGGVTFEVIYCSGQYFKTSSLYGDIWLGTGAGLTASTDGSYYAEALSLNVKPDGSVANAGYYGYKTNVSVYPISGNYRTGPMTLSFYEVESGYYNANNIEVHSIPLKFKLE